MKTHAQFGFGLLLLASFGMVTGCGGKSGDKNTMKSEVTGKVTLGDKPVSGQVVFVYSDGKELVSPITGDGSYMLADPPTGSVKIYIRSMGGTVVPKGGPDIPKDAPGGGGGVPAPPKYASAATSGLTYEVKAGKQEHNIPLNK
jgi:hypothetical protein